MSEDAKIEEVEVKEEAPVEVNASEEGNQPLQVSREDLELILKQQGKLQNAERAVGLLELRKFEMMSEILSERKSTDLVIQTAMEKVGIEKSESKDYVIDPRTGQVLKRQQNQA